MNRVEELFKDIDYKLIRLTPDFSIGGLCCDSRTVKDGDLFIAVKGCEQDGHDYIKEAIKKGAAAICSTRLPKDLKDIENTRFIIVKDTTKILPILASRFFGKPTRFLKFIGITGTNGKTTTCYLVYEILKNAKKSPSLLGTIQYRIGNKNIDSFNTTPGLLPLHSFFSEMRENGSDYVVMELSSHALKQGRVKGIDFNIAALTNITGDHLDYHRTMLDYVKSKRLLFESLKNDSFAILNHDDKFYKEFIKSTRGKLISYGINEDSDFKATDIKLDINGSRFVINTPKGMINVKTHLIGLHNIYNILAATSISFAVGIDFEVIRDAIARFGHVAGRLESIEVGQHFKVFIDYAHTHDALEKILSMLKKLCNGKIILVFGCGGNRDRTKRPKMGRIASSLADYVILTDDNPREEDPEAILSEIEKGFQRGFKSYKKIPDRLKAIEEALTNRELSDIVLIAGKGHEDYQIIGDRKFPFNDKKVAEKILGTATLAVMK